ncbi:MAG: hypothetical protein ACXABY_13930, partial [Candidatus Thorarchaeota archaeon]
MAQPSQDLIVLPVPIARGGLNKDIEPTSLERIYSPYMLNMVLEARRVRKRLGYRQLGSNLPLLGTGCQLINYIDARGVSHDLAITTRHIYKYDSSSDNWQPITSSTDLDDCETGWTGAANVTLAHDTTYYIRGSKSAKMTLTAQLTDGDQMAYKDIGSVDLTSPQHTHIGFWLRSDTTLAANALEVVVSESNHASGEKTGTYVECLSTALTADTWTFVSLAKTLTDFDATISVSIYANATIANGTNVWLDDIRGYTELAGDDAKRVNWTIAHDLNEFTNNGGSALILTNGVDDVVYYEAQSGGSFATLVHGYPSFANTVEISEFWNHFMFVNFNNGSANVRSVAWADVGDIDDFSAGTSGLSYLTDSRGKLSRAIKLGPDLVLYSDRSITTCKYHGGTIIYLFPTLVYRTGLYSHSAIVGITTEHIFLGTDQRIYSYRGGVQLVEVGKNIESSFFNELDSSKKDYIVSDYDEANDFALFCFPRSSDSYAQAAYVL